MLEAGLPTNTWEAKTQRALPGIFLAQLIMCTSSLSASLVRDIIMEASVNGVLGRLTSTLGGSASRSVSTSCSGLRAFNSSSFTRLMCPPFFLALFRQCNCSLEFLCLRAMRYPHLSLLEPKVKSRWRCFPRPLPKPSSPVPRVARVKMKKWHHCKTWVCSQNAS